MKKLTVYTNIKDLELKQELLKQSDGISSTLMMFEDFYKKMVLLPDFKNIEPIERVFLLQKASSEVQNFQDLNISLKMRDFYTQSRDIFQLFHELSYNFISFDSVYKFKIYDGFENEMRILEDIFKKYIGLLEKEEKIDELILHFDYEINHYFIDNYDEFEFHIDKNLNQFELSLIESIKKDKKLFTKNIKNSNNNVNSYQVKEKLEQVALAFELIDEMKKTIEVDKIAIILPDEKLKELFIAYDRCQNITTQIDFSSNIYFKIMNKLLHYIEIPNSKEDNLFKKFDIDVNNFLLKEKIDINDFFSILGVVPLQTVSIKELMISSLEGHFLLIDEWLFIWLEEIKNIKIEDENGGKIKLLSLKEAIYHEIEGVIIVDFNEGVVPSTLARDRFLNSDLRKQLGLPTSIDIQNEEKKSYIKLINHAKEVALIHSISSSGIASNFLYELGVKNSISKEVDYNFFYDISPLTPLIEPQNIEFNAFEFEWSSTMLKNYLECKQKFYYKYILKIAQRADTTPNDGQILHKVLENLFKDRSFYEDEEALRDNLKTLIAQEVDDSTVSNIYKKRLWERKLEHLVSKQIKHFSDGWRVVAREKRVYGEIGGLKFKGSIDRIDQTPTHSLVIDYKSGSIKKVNSIKKFENLSDFQMNIYKELTKKTLSNVEFAYIEILDSGDLIKVDRMDEKEEYLMEHIANLKATKTLNLEKRADIHNCNYCEYQLLCQRGAYLR